MEAASGTETKTDTQTPPLVVQPVAGPFKNDTKIERGWDKPIVFTMEEVLESPRYKWVPTDGQPESHAHVEYTGETHTTKRTSTFTLSPLVFKIGEVLEDSHRMPQVVSGKKPCGCGDKDQTHQYGGGQEAAADSSSKVMMGVAALLPLVTAFAPQISSVTSSLFGLGGKKSSASAEYVSASPAETSPSYYWMTYCREKGVDPAKRATEDELKDFETWLKDAASQYVDVVRRAQSVDPAHARKEPAALVAWRAFCAEKGYDPSMREVTVERSREYGDWLKAHPEHDIHEPDPSTEH